MSIGEQFRQIRNEKGLSQPELAEIAGIEQSYLSKLENGRSLPSNEMFRKMLAALDISLNQFLKRFDLEADRPKLSQVPDIEHWYKQRDKKKLGSQRRYLYLCGALITISVGLFYLGYISYFKAETHQYYLDSIDPVPEKRSLFNRHRLLIFGEYKGPSYTKAEEGKTLRYEYSGVKTTSHGVNTWLKTFGLMLFTAGVVGLFLERRIFKV